MAASNLLSASPKNVSNTNIYYMFGNMRQQTPVRTPTQTRAAAGGMYMRPPTEMHPSPMSRRDKAEPMTVINLFTQPVSCSNYYNSSFNENASN